MKVKKILLLILSLVLVLSSITACSDRKTDKLKVGVVYISPKDDGGYSQAHARGFAAAVKAIGEDKVDLLETENVDDTDPAATEAAIRTLVENGCKIVFATSWGYMDTVEKLAEEYTDVKFEHCSGVKNNDTNFDNYFAQIEQARYLTGIIAGYVTKTNNIAYVAAHPLAEVIRGLNAFTMGVRSVNPEATVHVKWTVSWFNPDVERENAIAMITTNDCDVMAQHQDSPTALIAAQEHGILGFSYNSPGAEFGKEAYLTAPLFNWAPYYETKIRAILDDKWEVKQEWGGWDTGIVSLDEYSDKVPQEAKDKIEEVIPKLEGLGNAYFFTGPIKDNKGNVVVEDGVSLTKDDNYSMDWLVEGVSGELP